jgi:hypothetical protein
MVGSAAMNVNNDIEAERLALNFAAHAKEQFEFLVKLGYYETASLPTLVRYHKGDIEVDVYHGRQSYEIGFGITYDGIRFSLEEFIRAIDTGVHDLFRYPSATTEDVLIKGLAKTAEKAKRYCLEALGGNIEVFESLIRLRKVWLKELALSYLATQLRPKAHEAFRLHRYREAAELYRRIEPSLTPVEIKKLAFAEKRAKS